MDQFAEQLVNKVNTSQDDLKKTLVIAGAAILTILSLLVTFFIAPIAIVLPVGIIYLTVYFLKLQKVEYEYSCTNGTLDIDKILGQTKRVEMLSIDVSAFTVYGKAGECEESNEDMTTYSAVGISLMGEEESAETYYAEFDHPDNGKCCLYFTPNERLRSALEPFLPRTLKRKMA